MIVILDTAKGQSYNFKTRKEAGEFIGVSLPTLRGWLAAPFYLHESLIITHTSNEKIQTSRRALVKKQVRQIRQDEIDRVATAHVQGVFPHVGNVPINGSQSEEPATLAKGVKP
jgi:hypothetical protein